MGLPGSVCQPRPSPSFPGPFLGWVSLDHPRRLLLRLGVCRGREDRGPLTRAGVGAPSRLSHVTPTLRGHCPHSGR